MDSPLKNGLFAAIVSLTVFAASGQINITDSTAQVISYWNKGEKQRYSVTAETIELQGADTTSREMTTYDVEITVLDSSDKTYTVQWLYENIRTKNQDPIFQQIYNVVKDMKVIFTTDELGVFIEVVNWKEVKEYILQGSALLRKKYKDLPGTDAIMKQTEETYSTKEAIESSAIKDIQQFHSFHGAKYKLGEVLEGSFKAPNLYGGEPFDSDFSLYLDEINQEENNFILRSFQEINEEQLTNATFQYLTTMASLKKIEPPRREDLKNLKNNILTAARIHDSGWVVYSIQTVTVISDDATHIEERVIEIK